MLQLREMPPNREYESCCSFQWRLKHDSRRTAFLQQQGAFDGRSDYWDRGHRGVTARSFQLTDGTGLKLPNRLVNIHVVRWFRYSVHPSVGY